MALVLLVQLCVVLVFTINTMAAQRPFSIERRAGVTDYSNPADQQQIVDAHNNYRQNVNPPATNMNTLTWDAALATKAQQWVERCHYGHPNVQVYTDYAGLGQNLYIRSGTTTPPSIADPVNRWYNEVKYFDLATNKCKPGKVCGHYTQVVWADTTKVGCGTKYCAEATSDFNKTYKKAWLVACQYSPGGNVLFHKPYNTAN